MADALARMGMQPPQGRDALASARRVDEALATLSGEESGASEDVRADILRRRAELHAGAGAPPKEVEAIFREPLDTARHAPIHDGFIEGLDTLDLLEARSLLDGL